MCASVDCTCFHGIPLTPDTRARGAGAGARKPLQESSREATALLRCGRSASGVRWRDSGCVLKMEPTGFAEGLDTE